LKDITAQFASNTITALVGPSGIGKTTFLGTLNRLWESIPHASMEGNVEIKFDGLFYNIYNGCFSVFQLPRLVDMVFQTPTRFP